MAQRLTKAALASSPNVVKLPTAAPRKVKNWRFAAQRDAACQARKGSPFAERYIHPQVRAKMPDAAALMEMQRTPELLLLIAMFEALSEEQKAQIRRNCDTLKDTGPEARCAAAIVERRTICDSIDLEAAMTVLKGQAR